MADKIKMSKRPTDLTLSLNFSQVRRVNLEIRLLSILGIPQNTFYILVIFV